ncbi:MAG TPA: LLM class flavin-dependent oxidoreductase [Thermomicrobiaceae bacterium]|nr:LLM class flavin-dependent oxidoreductase [Thermomicrobiaceae bacterium]
MRDAHVQFGIFDIMQVPPGTSSREAYAEHLADVALVDELGLDYYFAAERHFMPHYRTPSPSVWLAACAARTSRVRLGALAYVVPLHNPMRLAEEVVMLDQLSDGRMEVGVGLGHRPEELVSLGIDPAVRQLLMMEGIVLMQRAWRGERFQFPGQVWQFSDLYVEAPVQRPFPPMWYAGNDPQAAQWAARNGLSLAVGFQGTEQLAGPCVVYRVAVRERETPEPSQRLALMRHLYVAETDAQAEEEMTGDMMKLGDVFAASPREVGAARPANLSRADALRAVRRLRSQEVVLAGSVETCARALAAAARRLTLDVFLANPYLSGLDAARVQRTLRLYAGAVAPRVRELLAEDHPDEPVAEG